MKSATVMLLALGLLGTATSLLAFRQPQRPNEEGRPGSGVNAPRPEEPDVYALLLIEDRGPRVLSRAGQAGPVDAGDAAAYRRTQAVLLKSRPVLRAALDGLKNANLAVVKHQANPLAWLEKNIRTSFVDNTGVLRVSLTKGSAPERAALINAVVQAYLNEFVTAEHRRKEGRLWELGNLMGVRQDELKLRRRQLRELADRLGGAPALKQQFDREDLASLRTELQRVRLEKIRARARLNYHKRAGGENAKAAIARLEEEVGILEEQEKLLQAEITPLVRAAREGATDTLASLRDGVSSAEQALRKMADEAEAMQVELRAEPRVRLLQEADAGRPGK